MHILKHYICGGGGGVTFLLIFSFYGRSYSPRKAGDDDCTPKSLRLWANICVVGYHEINLWQLNLKVLPTSLDVQ